MTCAILSGAGLSAMLPPTHHRVFSRSVTRTLVVFCYSIKYARFPFTISNPFPSKFGRRRAEWLTVAKMAPNGLCVALAAAILRRRAPHPRQTAAVEYHRPLASGRRRAPRRCATPVAQTRRRSRRPIHPPRSLFLEDSERQSVKCATLSSLFRCFLQRATRARASYSSGVCVVPTGADVNCKIAHAALRLAQCRGL